MVRGFNVNANQVNGSGDSLGEQARPLLQVEDIRDATGGETGLLDARDVGFYRVAMPNFWERPEMSGLLRDVTRKPAPYAWLDGRRPWPMAMDAAYDAEADDAEPDAAIAGLLRDLRKENG